MLPMFDGSAEVFRKILVPVLNQRESLILRDARGLAVQLLQHVPADRVDLARQAAAAAFMEQQTAGQ